MKKKNNIVFIDFSNFCYVVYYAAIFLLNKKWDGEIQPDTKMLYKLAMGKLNRIKEITKGHIIFVLDAGRGNKQSLLKEEYKGGRKKLKINPIEILAKKFVEEMEFKYSLGEEADDCIATLCKKYKDNKITIITTDQDMWQLVDKNIKLMSMTKLEYADKDKLMKKYGLKKWNRVVDYKVIFGDSSDNIEPIVKRLRRQPIIDKLNKGFDCLAIYNDLKKEYDIKKSEVTNRLKAIKLKTNLKVKDIKDKKEIVKVIKFKNK